MNGIPIKVQTRREAKRVKMSRVKRQQPIKSIHELMKASYTSFTDYCRNAGIQNMFAFESRAGLILCMIEAERATW